jgi:mevalonate kinase
VISYAQPVFFIRGQPFERLRPAQSFTIVIGNTGKSSPTGVVVGDVRKRWQADPAAYEQLFDQFGAVAYQARQVIEHGPVEALGELLLQNHHLLQELDVSSPELDRLVQAAQEAGALGAKLCGGGRGGNMIALVQADTAAKVAAALRDAGAVNCITTTVNQA